MILVSHEQSYSLTIVIHADMLPSVGGEKTNTALYPLYVSHLVFDQGKYCMAG